MAFCVRAAAGPGDDTGGDAIAAGGVVVSGKGSEMVWVMDGAAGAVPAGPGAVHPLKKTMAIASRVKMHTVFHLFMVYFLIIV